MDSFFSFLILRPNHPWGCLSAPRNVIIDTLFSSLFPFPFSSFSSCFVLSFLFTSSFCSPLTRRKTKEKDRKLLTFTRQKWSLSPPMYDTGYYPCASCIKSGARPWNTRQHSSPNLRCKKCHTGFVHLLHLLLLLLFLNVVAQACSLCLFWGKPNSWLAAMLPAGQALEMSYVLQIP